MGPTALTVTCISLLVSAARLQVRFETFLACRKIPGDKKGGRRFDIKVITGRTMQLEANTPEEADKWVRGRNLPCLAASSAYAFSSSLFPLLPVSVSLLVLQVTTIRNELGKLMAVLRVQTAWRVHQVLLRPLAATAHWQLNHLI